jgi:hypothetical protein
MILEVCHRNKVTHHFCIDFFNDASFLGQDYESYIGRMKEFEFMLAPEQ